MARMRDNSNLPGDDTNPNSPNYVESAFGRDDAAGNVAERWHVDGETAVALEAVADAEALLLWIGANVNVPGDYLRAYRDLLNLSGRLDKAITAEYEALNSPFTPDDDHE